MRSFPALLRRELWEHTALYRLPLALILLVFLGNLATILWGSDVGIYVALKSRSIHVGNVNEMASSGAGFGQVAGLSESIRLVMAGIGMMIYSVMWLLVAIYALDSLFKERKDKSILFWKSLPVSDVEIVLSKLVTAVVVIPLIAFVAVAVSQLLTWFMQGMALGELPDALATLWDYAGLPHFWVGFLFLEIEQLLWFFPLVGWLLLCSAWAKKSPATWAFALPLLLSFIDSAFRLHTGFTQLLSERLSFGLFTLGPVATRDGGKIEGMDGLMKTVDSLVTSSFGELMQYLFRPEVLGGLVVGVIFVALATLIRRRRGDESNLLIPTGA
ncbi:ABC-2 transporter permease [Thiolapillus brandeum]|nr:ABC-2 transporter permease [Thiolapillus brandeum]